VAHRHPLVRELQALLGQDPTQEQRLLATPASEVEIARFQEAIGLLLPDSFYAFYRWHNGSQYAEARLASVPLYDAYHVLSLEGILQTKQMFDEHQRNGVFDAWEEGVYWNLGWVPYLEIDYWYVQCIDTVGCFGGQPGQVLGFDYKSASDRSVEHRSFDKWLETLIEVAKAGLLNSGIEEEEEAREDEYQRFEALEEIEKRVNGEYAFHAPIWPHRRKHGPPNPHYSNLVDAIQNDDLSALQALLAEGKIWLDEVDEYSEARYSPLLLAIEEHRFEIAKWLVRQGASLSYKDAYGQNAPIKAACCYEMRRRGIVCRALDIELIDLMHQRGATLPYSMLMGRAVSNNHLEMLEYCLARGADINEPLRNYARRTLLHHAIERNASLAVVRWLIDHSIDVAALDHQGHTARELLQPLLPLASLRPELAEIDRLLAV
jgi:cell wall assembly regulator SMI1